MTDNQDKAAPMASASMRYRDNGEVAWGEMWESFCGLALYQRSKRPASD